MSNNGFAVDRDLLFNENNLIWMDLEMTGLEPQINRILEMAAVITDPQLNVIAEGPVVAIHQDASILSNMDSWNTATHTRSGLVNRCLESKEDVLQQESVRLTNEWKTNFDHEHPDGTPGQDNLWLVSLLDFYKDHAEFYLALYHAGLSNIMLETILGYFDRSPEIPNGLAYLNSAIGYMLYGWVHEWMNRGMQESGTEIARMFAGAQKKQA